MPEAVAEYAAAQRGSDAWMLGRFVLTAARLPEFAEAMASMAAPAEGWRLSAIVRDGSQADRDAISAFNAASARHHAIVDTIECKPQTLEGIDWLAEAFGPSFDVYVEVDRRRRGPALAGAGGRARAERQGADRWPDARRIPQPGGAADVHRGCRAVEGAVQGHCRPAPRGARIVPAHLRRPGRAGADVRLPQRDPRDRGHPRRSADGPSPNRSSARPTHRHWCSRTTSIRWGAAEWPAEHRRGARAPSSS